MNGRSSGFVIIARMFVFILSVTVASSFFWNGLSGRSMFPLEIAICVAVILTAFFVAVGFFVVTVGCNQLLRNDPTYEQWKAQGGRTYLDSLPRPINPDSDAARGFSELPPDG